MLDEERLLTIVSGAGDRRDASDELALLVDGPATRHHLARSRANVVRPLRFLPGMRVLDAFGESGAIARHVGERGAEVVCLAGSLARVAAARCEGLAGVTVLPVGVDGFDDREGFDVVLGVGEGPPVLGSLTGLVREGGVLVLAADNPVGVRWLLGWDDEPWATKPARPSPRRVRALLGEAGFPALRRLLAFPDHRLTTALLDERAYAGTEFVDQLVRWPCRHDPASPLYVCDDRAAHRVFVDAGIGPEVANASVLVCGRTAGAVDGLVDPETVAWVFTGERRRAFLGWKAFGEDTVRAERVERDDGGPAAAGSGWLAQSRSGADERRVGRTVEQLALAACAEGPDAVGAVLRRWCEHLVALECEPGDEPHPYRTRRSTRFLPADHLDVNLPNFVVSGDGTLHYVDDEWRAPSAVDADLVRTRALWWFAVDLVHRGVDHPWPAPVPVDELTASLGECAGVQVDVAGMLAGEAAMQAQVSGLPYEHWQVALAALGGASRTEPAVTTRLPFAPLQKAVAELAAEVADLSWRLDEVRDRNRELVARAQADWAEPGP